MNTPNKFVPKIQSIRAGLLFIVAFANITLLAQTTSSPQAAVDLTAPALRAHANLPKYFRSGRPLTQDLAEARVTAASRGIPWKGLRFIVNDGDNLAGFTKIGALQLYQNLACKADVVAVGHTNLSARHLSAWGTVYTDYVFVIDALLKDNQKSSIRSKPDIVVTRPGGSLLVNNDPVTFEFHGFPELNSTTTYLQFLKYIPESSAYQVLDPYSTLLASGSDWVVARRSSAVALPGLMRGVLEVSISNWLTSCKQ